jgi:hypothetical protein
MQTRVTCRRLDEGDLTGESHALAAAERTIDREIRREIMTVFSVAP